MTSLSLLAGMTVSSRVLLEEWHISNRIRLSNILFRHVSYSYHQFSTNYYPHAFLKSVGDIAIASVRPSVTLSPPKPLDEIQPNLVCELLN